MNDWPAHYSRLQFPDFGNHDANRKFSWDGIVADRARIRDPQFHGGKTEAIRLYDKSKDEPHPQYPWIIKRGVSEWIEFRNFKDANAFVQAYKRLSE